MTYESKLVSDTLQKLKDLMNHFPSRKEYAINEKKIREFELILTQFYLEAFKQGVYTTK